MHKNWHLGLGFYSKPDFHVHFFENWIKMEYNYRSKYASCLFSPAKIRNSTKLSKKYSRNAADECTRSSRGRRTSRTRRGSTSFSWRRKSSRRVPLAPWGTTRASGRIPSHGTAGPELYDGSRPVSSSRFVQAIGITGFY